MTKEQDKQIIQMMADCGGMLNAMAFRMTGERATAEDLVQDAFVLLCQNVDILSRHENPKGWLYKATYNLAQREMKRAYRKRNVPLEPEEIEGAPGLELPMDLHLPDGLKPHEREIILMRLEQGLSYEEIALLLGMKEAACRQSYSRAIRKCRELYWGKEPADADKK